MQDLARALVRELVLLPALVGGEEPQRAPREVRIERQVLERGDDAVAAERGHEPRNARVGDAPVHGGGGEHAQIRPGPGQPAVEARVAAGHLHRGRGAVGIRHPGRNRARPVRRRLLVGGDAQPELDDLAGRHREPVARETRGHLLGRRREGEGGDAQGAVESPVGETRERLVQVGGKDLAPPVAHHAAHLEDVREVRGVVPRQHQLVRRGVEALDGQHLVEPPRRQLEPPGQPQGPPAQHHDLAVTEIGIGEVGRHVAAVGGDGGAEAQGPLPVHGELEAAQEAGAVHVETELALGQIREVAVLVRDQERVVALRHQALEIGPGGGGADVVGVARALLVVPLEHHRCLLRPAALPPPGARTPPRSRPPCARR